MPSQLHESSANTHLVKDAHAHSLLVAEALKSFKSFIKGVPEHSMPTVPILDIRGPLSCCSIACLLLLGDLRSVGAG